MKFSSLLFYLTLSLSCAAMEIITDTPVHLPKKNLKRSLSDNTRALRDKTDIKKGRSQEHFEQANLNELLGMRAELLIHEVNKAVESLKGIREALQGQVLEAKVLAQKNNNYHHVSELAGLIVSTISLDKSANLILANLVPLRKSKEEDVISKASIAIIASGALEGTINQFLEITKKYHGVKESNYNTLREAHDKIKEITDDIPIKNKLVTLDESK